MINIPALHLAKIATQMGLYPQVETSFRIDITHIHNPGECIKNVGQYSVSSFLLYKKHACSWHALA